MYWVYILQSRRDKKLYTGITADVKKRIQEHNRRKNLSTKSRAPFDLLYKEKCESRVEARKREKFLKSGCGREWVKNNISGR